MIQLYFPVVNKKCDCSKNFLTFFTLEIKNVLCHNKTKKLREINYDYIFNPYTFMRFAGN